MLLLLLIECKGKHYQGKHHETKELCSDDVPGPLTKEVKERWMGGFLAQVHEIGPEQVVDTQDKHEIQVDPKEGAAKTLPGGTKTIHKNGVQNALKQAHVYHKKTEVQVVRKTMIQRRREQGLDAAAHHHVVRNFKKKKRASPEHEGQHQVHEVANVERKYQTQIHSFFKKNHVKGNKHPQDYWNQTLNEANSSLSLFVLLLFTQPNPKNRAEHTNGQPDEMLRAVTLEIRHK